MSLWGALNDENVVRRYGIRNTHYGAFSEQQPVGMMARTPRLQPGSSEPAEAGGYDRAVHRPREKCPLSLPRNPYDRVR